MPICKRFGLVNKLPVLVPKSKGMVLVILMGTLFLRLMFKMIKKKIIIFIILSLYSENFIINKAYVAKIRISCFICR